MFYIEELLSFQRNFFKSGATQEYAFRLKALKRLKKCIKKNEKAIYNALKLDLNKPRFESFVGEVGFVLKEIEFVIDNLKAWMKPKKVPTDIVNMPAKSFIYHQPYGTVLIISPWNYPFHLSIMPLIGAISAGNTAVLKPSEFTENTAILIDNIISDCFDKRYIAAINGGRDVAEELLEHKFDKIFYTGNSAVGRVVMQKAAKYLTPVCLELGGKTPAIVLKDANIKMAAKRIVWGKFFNAGQTCVAVDYLAVEEAVYGTFVEALRNEVEKYVSMKNFEENYSKMINRRHFERVLSLIDKTKIIFGGEYSKERLTIYPTVVSAKPDDKIMEDEIFGPVLPVLRFRDYEGIRTFIISKEKPLALYLFTQDRDMKKKVLSQIQSGGVTINDTLVHLSSNYLPFGGIGESGMGSYHGIYSFNEFSQKRAVMERSTKIDIPLRYPPYKGKLPIVKRFF